MTKTNPTTVPEDSRKHRLWCQAEDCDDTIEDDDDVVWVNYQQGECYHRGCYVTDDS